jgi:hypothetical protein
MSNGDILAIMIITIPVIASGIAKTPEGKLRAMLWAIILLLAHIADYLRWITQ